MPTLERAILWTVAYADIFDYPMTAQEIHWFLWGKRASREMVDDALNARCDYPLPLSCVTVGVGNGQADYYTLPGREELVALRLRREQAATRLWARAWLHAEWIARLPFVRMVALTGSLAVGNFAPDADIDFLIVTESGRLWLCRAGVIGIGLLAERSGDVICPNYFLSENALSLRERNCYTAREFAQMVPLYGLDIYQRLWAENTWVSAYLPNANGQPCQSQSVYRSRPAVPLEATNNTVVKRIAEGLLRTAPGAWLDKWEMRRKVRKFSRLREYHPESAFSPDWCKGHFNDHMAQTLRQFAQRMRHLPPDDLNSWIAEADAAAIA